MAINSTTLHVLDTYFWYYQHFSNEYRETGYYCHTT